MTNLSDKSGSKRTLILIGILALSLTAFALIWNATSEPAPGWAEAIETGDEGLARRLAAEGIDPDGPRVLGFTPLMRAAARDQAAIAAVLVDAGADLQAKAAEGIMAIHLAAQSDSVEVVELLVTAGLDPTTRSSNGMNALDHAAAQGSARVIVWFAERGWDLDQPSEVVAQGHGYPRDRGAPPLGIAAREGQIRAVEALLESGASVDSPSQSGNSPLLLAVFANAPVDLVVLLLENGADPDLIAVCAEACSTGSGDALYWAQQLARANLTPILEQAVGSE